MGRYVAAALDVATDYLDKVVERFVAEIAKFRPVMLS